MSMPATDKPTYSRRRISRIAAMAILLCGGVLFASGSSKMLLKRQATRLSTPAVQTNSDSHTSSRGRSALDDVMLFENFDLTFPDSLPHGWLQVDGDGGYSSWFQAESRWRVFHRPDFFAHSGSRMVLCHFNDNGLPNNDWLILPAYTASDTIMLDYWAASQDQGYLESYEVRASAGGTEPADFTTLLYSNPIVPAAWTHYTHDLSALAGTTFRIAFHYTSADRFALKLDDIQLAGTPQNSGWIAGTCTDDFGGAVPFARAQIISLGQSVYANEAGQFAFPLLPAGTYPIRMSHEFHQTRVVPSVAITQGDTTFITPVLTQHPIDVSWYRSGSGTVPILDFDTSSMWLNINDTLIISDLDVLVRLDHSYIGDLEIWLQSPDTTIIPLLHADVINNGSNLDSCRFDDDAPYSFAQGTAPYHGHWRPASLLEAVDGDSSFLIRGPTRYRTWRLFVYDGSEGDVGTLLGFSIYLACEMGVVHGTVTDQQTGEPLADVNVFLQGRRDMDSLITSSDGVVNFPRTRVGAYTLVCTRAEFDTLRLYGVAVHPGDTAEFNAVMQRTVSADPLPVPIEFAFRGVYPNPFNSQTRIEFSLPNTSLARLDLYNMVGQHVARILDKEFAPGVHAVLWDATALPSGIYFAHLTAGGQATLRKVVLLK